MAKNIDGSYVTYERPLIEKRSGIKNSGDDYLTNFVDWSCNTNINLAKILTTQTTLKYRQIEVERCKFVDAYINELSKEFRLFGGFRKKREGCYVFTFERSELNSKEIIKRVIDKLTKE